jgi:23S rRNA (uridine2552-2'-O)-methyltransferase
LGGRRSGGPAARRSEATDRAGRAHAAQAARADGAHGKPPARRTARPNDHFGAAAKAAGYPARSVWKLEEIDRRLGLLRRGQRVLDLGAFPGAWTMYAARRVAPGGQVIGYDLQEFRGGLPPGAEIRTGDVFALDPGALGVFDMVLSDMAPSTTGTRMADQARSHALFLQALRLCESCLRPGGAFVGKLFQGPDFEEARAALRRLFRQSRVMKPEASRQESIEVFLVGLDRRPPGEA